MSLPNLIEILSAILKKRKEVLTIRPGEYREEVELRAGKFLRESYEALKIIMDSPSYIGKHIPDKILVNLAAALIIFLEFKIRQQKYRMKIYRER